MVWPFFRSIDVALFKYGVMNSAFITSLISKGAPVNTNANSSVRYRRLSASGGHRIFATAVDVSVALRMPDI